MSKVYMMVTIANRGIGSKIHSFYQKHGQELILSTLGMGTANSEMLDYFGLEATEKTVMLSVVTRERWKELK